MRTELAAGIFMLSSCAHRAELPQNRALDRVESPAAILSELLTTIANIQELDFEGRFGRDPLAHRSTTRIAITDHESISLSGYPHNGRPEKPGCLVNMTSTSFGQSLIAKPVHSESRLSVTFMPENKQNLLIGRGTPGEFTESINCYQNAGVTSCTYHNGESTQPVSAGLVQAALGTADLMCNSFRQVQ